jgi:hypothetical protein
MWLLNFLRKTALWIVLTPLAITFTGTGLNQLVLNANHDTFPVEVNTLKEQIFVAKAAQSWRLEQEAAAEGGVTIGELPAGMIDEVHCVMTSKTHLNFLADVFDFKDGIYSLGDGLIYLGEWLMTFSFFVWVFEVIRRANAQQ